MEEKASKTTKPWQLKEWHERRQDILEKSNGTCNWCGNVIDTHFTIHHPGFQFDSLREWEEVALTLFEQTDTYKNLPTEIRFKCPNCDSPPSSLRERKTKNPKWACNQCHGETDNPAQEEYFQKEPFRKAYKEFVKNESNKEYIRLAYEKKKKEHWEKYMSLKGTIILCRKCHFMWEVHHKKPCPKCKNGYVSPQYEMCFNCAKKEGIIKQCKECNKWVRELTEYGICFDCEEEEWEQEWENE